MAKGAFFMGGAKVYVQVVFFYGRKRNRSVSHS